MSFRKIVSVFDKSGDKKPPFFECDLCGCPAEYKCDDCTKNNTVADQRVYIGSGEDFLPEMVQE